jgi:hypothetical protein
MGSVSILANSKVVNNLEEMIPDPQDPEGMIPGDGVYAPQASPIANQAEFDSVGTLRTADSTVSGNYAEQNGGGVANLGSGTLTIERSTITDNTTEAQGGGVYGTGAKLTVTVAFEFEGPPPPVDNQAPDTEYISGPIQDSLETAAFQFTGTDEPDPNSGNKTSTEDLQYECRLIENDPAEPQEPIAPWDPIPPEFWWLGCEPGWQAPLLEEGMFTFEVRAIDRAGNVDETPATRIINGNDTSLPETTIDEKPPAVSPSRAATFTFAGTDNLTPTQFLEYERRLDSRDPELWLECFNPTIFAKLTSGEHTLEVRARRRREHGPDASALQVDGRAAPELRRGEHHADGRGRRLGRPGQPG